MLDNGNFVGTPIGIAGSKDLANWRLIGYCSFNELGGKPDAKLTYWAPSIFIEGDTANMFITYNEDTIGHGAVIVNNDGFYGDKKEKSGSIVL